eukprot:TRINITY_DN10405_c0_g1_i1.p2 TRINITY_DN10405_c0_g1~~TRINITY_DN10405_c0_g1_i1.p2  ORF type:complete len:103 (-),score=3.31 TRINITY_DN10405_c0_g1_i1:11-319(-)
MKNSNKHLEFANRVYRVTQSSNSSRLSSRQTLVVAAAVVIIMHRKILLPAGGPGSQNDTENIIDETLASAWAQNAGRRIGNIGCRIRTQDAGRRILQSWRPP